MVAFAVFLQAVRFLAVATFDVLVSFDLLSEGVRVSVHQCQNSIVSFFTVGL